MKRFLSPLVIVALLGLPVTAAFASGEIAPANKKTSGVVPETKKGIRKLPIPTPNFKSEFWKKEGERSGLAGLFAGIKPMNPVAETGGFLREQNERYLARKNAKAAPVAVN